MDFSKSVLDGMTDMVRVVDAQRKVLFSNETMDRMFGACADAPCYSIHCEQPCDVCVGLRAIQSNEVHKKQVKVADKVYSVVATPFQPDDAQERLCIEVWRDVTDSFRLSEALRKRDQKILRDLHYARRIQWDLLPRQMPKMEGYFFDAAYKPCEELSGDLYDLFAVDDETIIFCIADVAGHGITSAMLTVLFNRLLRSEARNYQKPSDMLDAITRRYRELEFEEQLYITAVIGKLHLPTGRVTWCNAGHSVAPVLYYPNGTHRTLFMPGLPISRWDIPSARHDDAFTLTPGTRMFLFTDGLEEVWQASGRPDDAVARLRSILSGSAPGEVIKRLMREFNTSKLKDDVAMLLLCRETAG